MLCLYVEYIFQDEIIFLNSLMIQNETFTKERCFFNNFLIVKLKIWSGSCNYKIGIWIKNRVISNSSENYLFMG